jgi:hypothetical protein
MTFLRNLLSAFIFGILQPSPTLSMEKGSPKSNGIVYQGVWGLTLEIGFLLNTVGT